MRTARAARSWIAEAQIAYESDSLADGEADGSDHDQQHQPLQVVGVPRQLTEAVFEEPVENQRADDRDDGECDVIE